MTAVLMIDPKVGICVRALICSVLSGGISVVTVTSGAIILGVDAKYNSLAGIILLSVGPAFALSCVLSRCICKKASGN